MQLYKNYISITEELTSRVFSVHLLCLFDCTNPFIMRRKSIQAKKHFLITPHNQSTRQRKQVHVCLLAFYRIFFGDEQPFFLKFQSSITYK